MHWRRGRHGRGREVEHLRKGGEIYFVFLRCENRRPERVPAGGQDDNEKCPQCGGSHPGLKPGDSVPEGTELRRGIPADKVKPDGSISKSAFKDTEMSVDIAAT